MKIFIVGGAGFIGSHMAKFAHKAGHDVISIDNLSTGHKDSVLYGRFEYCDINDPINLYKLFKKYQPEAVMHFGAFSIVNESINDPYKYYFNNISGTINLLKVMIDQNCRKLIFSSSAAIFGNPEYIPIDENHPKNPINPYGKSKLFVEKILRDFDSAYGLKYVSLRYFNAAGQDPEGDLEELHFPETHLIPILMQASRGQIDSFRLFGDDYDTHDGSCIRDFIHVNDIAQAHLRGLDYLNIDNSKSEEFNLGNGNGYSVKDVIEKVKNLTGSDFKVEIYKRRLGDPSILVASSLKAKKILKFNPIYSTLDKIIETLI